MELKYDQTVKTLINGETPKQQVEALVAYSITKQVAALEHLARIGQAGSRVSIGIIAYLLLNDESEWVRAVAAAVLAQLGNSCAIEHLQRALKEDKSSWVRRSAKDALRMLGAAI